MFWQCIRILSLATLLNCLTVNNFKPTILHSSQPSGFYNIETGSITVGQMLAFGDLNGDRLYILSHTASIILPVPVDNNPPFTFTSGKTVLLSHSAQFIQESFKLSSPIIGSISDVMICDLEGDGYNQIVVTYMLNTANYSTHIFKVNCTNPKTTSTNCSYTQKTIDYSQLSNMSAPPFLLDLSSSGRMTIVVFNDDYRKILSLNSESAYVSQQFTTLLLDVDHNMRWNRVDKHFASIVDVNGDCHADLVLLSKESDTVTAIEIFVKKSNVGYQMQPKLLIHKQITWLTFADMEARGVMDLLFLATENGHTHLYIIRNRNSAENICNTYPNTSYTIQKLQQLTLPANYQFHISSPLFFADVNLDGYPDLLSIFSKNQFRVASIMLNLQGNLTHSPAIDLSELQQLANPSQVAYYDFLQDGKIDMIIMSTVTKEDKSIVQTRNSIINNLLMDTLFVKILPLTTSSSLQFGSRQIVADFGVTIQWRITNIDGNRIISLLNQRAQLTHNTLLLPFVTTGLGRTNNYIQDLTVGYQGMTMLSSWTPIIPNSQLMVYPQSRIWKLEMLLKDNSRLYAVAAVSLGILLLIGIIIFALNYRQLQQDKRDYNHFIQMIR